MPDDFYFPIDYLICFVSNLYLYYFSNIRSDWEVGDYAYDAIKSETRRDLLLQHAVTAPIWPRRARMKYSPPPAKNELDRAASWRTLLLHPVLLTHPPHLFY